MSLLRAIAARVRGLLEKDRTAYLADELKEHAALLADDYVRAGMTPDDARYAALRALGNVTAVEEAYHEQKSLPLVENFWLDLKYALRCLRRNRAFTAACITTLSLGLGAMITALCVISAFFWKPLPYPQADQLVVVNEVDPRGGLWPFSQPALLDLEERSRSFSAVGALQRRMVALTGVGAPEILQAAAVTPSLFQMMGIKPYQGAALRDKLPFVVLSRRFAQRKWVPGQVLLLDGVGFTVAGVADLPDDLLARVDVLLPLEAKASESRTAREIDVVFGRLRTGVKLPQAQAELSTVAASMARQYAKTNAGWGMRITPLADYVTGPATARMVWMIFAAVALLWMLACINVAGLQVARSVARQHEMSTRLALGASKRRLLGQTLTESFVLALAGGLLGLVAAQFAIGAIRSMGADFFPRLASLELEGWPMIAAVGCLFASTVLSGLWSMRTPTYQGGRELSRRDRGRDLLIVAQVSLACILLLGASLLAQSFLRLRAVNPGFDPERVLTVRVNLAANTKPVAFFRNATEQLLRVPEIESVAATNVVPFSGAGTANRFRVEGEAGSEEYGSAEYRSAAWRAVTPGFFQTLGVPLKRGRLFNDADANGAQEVVILSESMARQYWPNQDPLGKRLLWGSKGSAKTIVGVVGDLRDLALDARPVPTMFRPFAQLSDAPMTFVLRIKGDPAAAIADIRRGIANVDGNAALSFQPLRQAMADSILRPWASLWAMAGFAMMALATAGFGLYGLISYRVNQRQQEIGIRLALGAAASSVRWSVQKRCLSLVCAGAAIGLPVAFAVSRLLRSLLYETEPTEAGAYALVLVVFAAVALLASFGPARKASRMDPAAAIRHE